jgi:hypothetical protein
MLKTKNLFLRILCVNLSGLSDKIDLNAEIVETCTISILGSR